MPDLVLYHAPKTELSPASQIDQLDLVQLLLNDKRSEHTKRAYARDLADFFGVQDEVVLRDRAALFCALSVPEVRLAVGAYKTAMRGRELSEATINRRLAAIRSLLLLAHRLGRSQSDGRNIAESEKVTSYRDTRGVDVATLRKLLAAPEKLYGTKAVTQNGKLTKSEISPRAYISSDILLNINNVNVGYARTRAEVRDSNRELHRLRDLAILHLLIENALRRSEVCKLDIGDFDASTRSLWILGKGRGQQKERISLAPGVLGAIVAYLALAGHGSDLRSPIFRNLDPNPQNCGNRLTPDGLYYLIGFYGRAVGLTRLTPHQLRHSAITAALDATGGDVRKVQKLSRHKKIETVMIYSDNMEDVQGEVSGLLSGLISGKKKTPRH